MQQFAEIVRLDQTVSTNDHLSSLWNQDSEASTLTPYTVVLANFQTGGRGRLDRSWNAPAGAAMLCSILVPIHQVGQLQPSMIPFTAGIVVAELLQSALPDRAVSLKWPNDVLVDGKKICGILAEYLGTRKDTAEIEWVALGIGVNLTQTREQLPIETATSITLENGPSIAPDMLAIACAAALEDLVTSSSSTQLLKQYADLCSTLGQSVRAILPTGDGVEGEALCLGTDGALIIATPEGTNIEIRAGDIVHVSPAASSRLSVTSTGATAPDLSTPTSSTSGGRL